MIQSVGKKNKILRIQLDDFIGFDIEKDILDFLEIIKNNSETNNFDVFLWYDKKNTSTLKLNKFKSSNTDTLNKLGIKVSQIEYIEDYAWYDIISKRDETALKKYKFRSAYTEADEILNCIIEFNNILKFDNSKNGYNKYGHKDAKDRNNWFKKVGEQTETKEHLI